MEPSPQSRAWYKKIGGAVQRAVKRDSVTTIPVQLSLHITTGESVQVTIDGTDTATAALEKICEAYLSGNAMRGSITFADILKCTVKVTQASHLVALPPFILSMPEVHTLALCSNKLLTTPTGLGTLANIQFLDLSDNHMKVLSDEVGELSLLTHLSVARNELTELPPSLLRIRKLESLDFSSNKISHLPSLGFFQLMHTMNASSNKLAELSLSELSPSLTWLDARDNKLTSLDNGLATRCASLSTLLLSTNKLALLPPALPPPLHFLDCCNNRLKECPFHIGRLKHLAVLLLDKNPIESLTFLRPDAFPALKRISVLSIDSEQLADHSPAPVAMAAFLQTLALKETPAHLLLAEILADISLHPTLAGSFRPTVVKQALSFESQPFSGDVCRKFAQVIFNWTQSFRTVHQALLTDMTEQNLSPKVVDATETKTFSTTQLKDLSDAIEVAWLLTSSSRDGDTSISLLATRAIHTLSDFPGAQTQLATYLDKFLKFSRKTASKEVALHLVQITGELCQSWNVIKAVGDAHNWVPILQEWFGMWTFSSSTTTTSTSTSSASASSSSLGESEELIQALCSLVLRLALSSTVNRKLLQSLRPMLQILSLNQHVSAECRRSARLAIAALGSITSAGGLQRLPSGKLLGPRILSIDGGGVRGVVTLQTLIALEAHTGQPTHKLFDLLVGTSTGGILAYALGLKRHSASQVERSYRQFAGSIFSKAPASGVGRVTASSWARLPAYLVRGSPHYSATTLSNLLAENLGAETPLLGGATFVKPARVACCASQINTLPGQSFLFRSYQLPLYSVPHSRYQGGCAWPAWMGLRASTAAPSYFAEAHIGPYRLMDGGVFANNPCGVALAEARALWPGISPSVILSLGTGSAPPQLVNLNDRASGRSIAQVVWAATDPDSVHALVEEMLQALGQSSNNGVNADDASTSPSASTPFYARIQPVDERLDIDLDNADPVALDQASKAARDYLKQPHIQTMLARVAEICLMGCREVSNDDNSDEHHHNSHHHHNPNIHASEIRQEKWFSEHAGIGEGIPLDPLDIAADEDIFDGNNPPSQTAVPSCYPPVNFSHESSLKDSQSRMAGEAREASEKEAEQPPLTQVSVSVPRAVSALDESTANALTCMWENEGDADIDPPEAASTSSSSFFSASKTRRKHSSSDAPRPQETSEEVDPVVTLPPGADIFQGLPSLTSPEPSLPDPMTAVPEHGTSIEGKIKEKEKDKQKDNRRITRYKRKEKRAVVQKSSAEATEPDPFALDYPAESSGAVDPFALDL